MLIAANRPRIFTDAATGRTVRQLTDLPGGAWLDYFRLRKHLSDGRIWAYGPHERGNLLLIDPDSGIVETLCVSSEGATVQLQAGGDRLWFFRRASREIDFVDLPHGPSQHAGKIPDDVPGDFADMTCDGNTLLLSVHHEAAGGITPIPTVNDPESIWRYVDRPRRGEIWTYDLRAGAGRRIVAMRGVCPDHMDASPVDPTLVRYCRDGLEAVSQRIWTVRTDGSDGRMIRPQARGEMITHEFWWPDGQRIGYTYMDRRRDDTLRKIPLNEYAPVPTQFGIADLDGCEIYRSQPLNCYHTHILISPDGKWIAGEGTHDHSFVYAGAFSMNSDRIDMKPLATIHTPYVPTRGQQVECIFSADGRWLLYNDTVNGKLQIFAVEVEV